MRNFNKSLQKQQNRFRRRVRKIVWISGVALILLIIAGITASRHITPVFDEDSRIEVEKDDDFQFTTVPTSDPEDPSQLVEPILIGGSALGRIVERQGIRFTPVDQAVLQHILSAVMAVPQEELKQRVDRSIVWDDFNDEDRRDRLIGRVCSFRGTLRRFEKNDSVDFPELGLDTVYEGQIQDALDRWYSFYVIEEPEREIGRHDVAEITGVFYQLITYPTRGGHITTPLIVGRTIEAEREHFAYQSAFERWDLSFFQIIIMLLISAAVLCLGLHFYLKKQQAEDKRRRKRRY